MIPRVGDGIQVALSGSVTKTKKLWLALSLAASLLGGLTSASEFRKFARADQVAASDLIAVGRVLSVVSAWAPDHSAIYTESEIALDEVWKGGRRDRVVVRTPGGTVGTVAAKVDASAEFAAGER